MKGRDQKIFLEALDELEKEKGILKEELLETIETALLAAYKKNYGEKDNVKVTINRNSGDVKVYSPRLIVENVEIPKRKLVCKMQFLLKSVLSWEIFWIWKLMRKVLREMLFRMQNRLLYKKLGNVTKEISLINLRKLNFQFP